MADRLEYQLRDAVKRMHPAAMPVGRLSQQRANITVAGASDRVALPAGATLIRLTATNDCYVQFGDNTVTADNTRMIFLKGTEVMFVPAKSATDRSAMTHIAALQVATGGTLQVEMLE